MNSGIRSYMESETTKGRITESVDVLVETHMKCSEDRDIGVGSFIRLAKDGDENHSPWLILVGRLDTLTRNATETAVETAKWLASRLGKTDHADPSGSGGEDGTVTVEITEKQAEILRELRQTCLERADGTLKTYIWEVYARTLGGILNIKESESKQ